jgi:hypothetical protein
MITGPTRRANGAGGVTGTLEGRDLGPGFDFGLLAAVFGVESAFTFGLLARRGSDEGTDGKASSAGRGVRVRRGFSGAAESSSLAPGVRDVGGLPPGNLLLPG